LAAASLVQNFYSQDLPTLNSEEPKNSTTSKGLRGFSEH